MRSIPWTVGKKGPSICGGCRHSEPRIEFVGISTIRRIKGHYDCMLEPNQRREVYNIVGCSEFSPKSHTIQQMTLDRWSV